MSQVTQCDRPGCTKEIPEGEASRVTLIIGDNAETGTTYDLEDVCRKCVAEIAKYAENGYRIKRKTKKEKLAAQSKTDFSGGDKN